MCTYSLVPITLASGWQPKRYRVILSNCVCRSPEIQSFRQNSLLLDDWYNHNPPALTNAIITNASACTDKFFTTSSRLLKNETANGLVKDQT